MSRHEYTGSQNLEIKSRLGSSTAEPSGSIKHAAKKLNPNAHPNYKHIFTVRPFDIKNKIVDHHIYKYGGKDKVEYEHRFTHVLRNAAVDKLMKRTKLHGKYAPGKVPKSLVNIKPKEELDRAPKNGVCLEHAYLTPEGWERFNPLLGELDKRLGLVRIGYTIEDDAPVYQKDVLTYSIYYEKPTSSMKKEFGIALRKLWQGFTRTPIK